MSEHEPPAARHGTATGQGHPAERGPTATGGPPRGRRHAPRTVVVSGGGTGIGLATARCFARDGDQLVLVGRRADVLDEAAATMDNAVPCPADLTTPDGARRVAELVRRGFGTVDVLVNAAGGTGAREPDPAASDPLAAHAARWALNFQLNTLTAVLLTEALRDRLASPGGRLLFISSIAAQRGSGVTAYAASKAALHPYAHACARELGPRGVTVNVIAPGVVAGTEIFGERGMTAERWQARIGETLNGRAGMPGDVAETAHWLASPGASHVTSQVIHVNGGAEHGR